MTQWDYVFFFFKQEWGGDCPAAATSPLHQLELIPSQSQKVLEKDDDMPTLICCGDAT
jgi:hypothetical protein